MSIGNGRNTSSSLLKRFSTSWITAQKGSIKKFSLLLCVQTERREWGGNPLCMCVSWQAKKKRKMKWKFTCAILLTLLPPRNGIEQFVFVWCFDGFWGEIGGIVDVVEVVGDTHSHIVMIVVVVVATAAAPLGRGGEVGVFGAVARRCWWWGVAVIRRW